MRDADQREELIRGTNWFLNCTSIDARWGGERMERFSLEYRSLKLRWKLLAERNTNQTCFLSLFQTFNPCYIKGVFGSITLEHHRITLVLFWPAWVCFSETRSVINLIHLLPKAIQARGINTLVFFFDLFLYALCKLYNGPRGIVIPWLM